MLVTYRTRLALCLCQFQWMDQPGIRSELLSLAFAGPPFSELAEALIALPDEQLASIQSSVGSFRDRRLLWKICRIQRVLGEFGGDIPIWFRSLCASVGEKPRGWIFGKALS